jgi:hypothetical protein
VLVTETDVESGDFTGTIELSTSDAPGVLHVSEGDVVTVTYIDADDGQGGVDVEVTDTAVVDCTWPEISNVQTVGVDARNATVTFDTNEPANGTVRYGFTCGALTETEADVGFGTSHTVSLSELYDATTYFYAVDAEDEATNVTTDDNGGTCYTFTTPEVPDYFTEEFDSGLDVEGLSLIFTPIGSTDFYFGCVEPITELPTDPAGGTTLSFSPSNDDGYANCTLTGGSQVMIYGTSYGNFYVGSNGYITFGGGDSTYSESLGQHFSMRRISGLFDDLNPSAGGSVSWKKLADRAAVTWQNVPEYYDDGSNTFQIEMYFDGTLVISYLSISASDGIVGLSEGNGIQPGFYETNLSGMGVCDMRAIVPWPENSLGVSCTIDDDCSGEARCVQEMCYVPKQRYLSIARNPEQRPDTARRVKLDTGDLIGWVGSPYYVPATAQHSGLWLADIVSVPQYAYDWPEVVHVRGCGVAHAAACDVSGVHCGPNTCPGSETCVLHSYHVQAIRRGQDIAEEDNYSDVLILHTPSAWGDTVAECPGGVCGPPDGICGLNDIMAAINLFQGKPTAPITWLDVAPSTGLHEPDLSIGLGDIMACIAGFQGEPYAGSGPLDCP